MARKNTTTKKYASIDKAKKEALLGLLKKEKVDTDELFGEIYRPDDVYGDTDSIRAVYDPYTFATASTVTFATRQYVAEMLNPPAKPAPPDPNTLPKYSSNDVDNLVSLLTLWVDDHEISMKIQKMYKHWRQLDKIKK